LGVYRGHASLRLGDHTGITMNVTPGDMLILPAGTAHQNLESSSDFHVVGGYPDGQKADLIRGDPDKFATALKRIAKVPVPTADPISGAKGPLTERWREANAT